MNQPTIQENKDAIKRLTRYIHLDKPSPDFSDIVMQRINFQHAHISKKTIIVQYIIIAAAACASVLCLIFPTWFLSFINIETLYSSLTQIIGNMLMDTAVWIGNSFSKIGSLGKYAYFIPASIALLVISLFDEVISKKYTSSNDAANDL